MKKQTLKIKKKITAIHKLRNKDVTKRLLLNAMLNLINKDGLKKLEINKVASEAGRSKNMIYRYFGGIEGLFDELINETDHWLSYCRRMDETMNYHSTDDGQELAALALKQHFDQFYANQMLQELSILELSDAQDFILEITKKRGRVADKLFAISSEYFQSTDINFRIICALLIGGINYMVLHSKFIKSTYCGVDINNYGHQKRLKKTITHLINWTYEEADRSNSKNGEKE